MNMNLDPQDEPFDTRTRSQIIFEIIMGIIAPILCLYFDPIFFRNRLSLCLGGPLFGSLVPFAYIAIAFGIFTLTIWLIAGSRISRGLGFIAGIFFADAAFALFLGIMMLPFSALGLLLIGLGLLGFIPFLTAIVYLRNGMRALRQAARLHDRSKRFWLFGAVLTGVLIVFGVAALVQWQTPDLFVQTQTVEQSNSCRSSSSQ